MESHLFTIIILHTQRNNINTQKITHVMHNYLNHKVPLISTVVFKIISYNNVHRVKVRATHPHFSLPLSSTRWTLMRKSCPTKGFLGISPILSRKICLPPDGVSFDITGSTVSTVGAVRSVIAVTVIGTRATRANSEARVCSQQKAS
jgi:hypothetical protein